MVKFYDFIIRLIEIRRARKEYCRSCETLRLELQRTNVEKQRLLDQFVFTHRAGPSEDNKPLVPNMIPWKVKREMLEQEDRAKAATMRRIEEDKKMAELEKELGVGE